MSDIETLFTYGAIGFAILLPFGLIKFAMRKRYIRELLERKAQGVDILVRQRSFIARYLGFVTWLSLLFVIAVPWSLSRTLGVNFSKSFACMALMFVNVLLEYNFQKSLYQSLAERKSQPPAGS